MTTIEWIHLFLYGSGAWIGWMLHDMWDTHTGRTNKERQMDRLDRRAREAGYDDFEHQYWVERVQRIIDRPPKPKEG